MGICGLKESHTTHSWVWLQGSDPAEVLHGSLNVLIVHQTTCPSWPKTHLKLFSIHYAYENEETKTDTSVHMPIDAARIILLKLVQWDPTPLILPPVTTKRLTGQRGAVLMPPHTAPSIWSRTLFTTSTQSVETEQASKWEIQPFFVFFRRQAHTHTHCNPPSDVAVRAGLSAFQLIPPVLQLLSASLSLCLSQIIHPAHKNEKNIDFSPLRVKEGGKVGEEKPTETVQ